MKDYAKVFMPGEGRRAGSTVAASLDPPLGLWHNFLDG
jgi:hypothetical protein